MDAVIAMLEGTPDRAGASSKPTGTVEPENTPPPQEGQVEPARGPSRDMAIDDEGVEQPHSSQKSLLQPLEEAGNAISLIKCCNTGSMQHLQDAIRTAMETLEACVLSATEAALKTSRLVVEKALQENWGHYLANPATPSSAGQPRDSPQVRESRPSVRHMLEDNIFERRRRVSIHRNVVPESPSPMRESRSPHLSGGMAAAEKPRRRSRIPTGAFNTPGAGDPANALPYWRPGDALSARHFEAVTWFRHPSRDGIGSSDTSSWHRLVLHRLQGGGS